MQKQRPKSKSSTSGGTRGGGELVKRGPKKRPSKKAAPKKAARKKSAPKKR